MSNAPRILGPALEVYNKLPNLMKYDIDDWLEDRCTKILYDKGDVLDAWLEWNGILGYGEEFRKLFEAMK